MTKTRKIMLGTLVLAAICLLFSSPSDSYLRARVVKLSGAQGMCTGEQVRAPSGRDYILTAAHCRIFEVDGKIQVTTEDGKTIPRRVLEEDGKSDLLILEGIPGLKGLDIAKTQYPTEHVRAFTHGHDLDTWKSEGELIQYQIIQVPLSLALTPEDEAKCNQPKNKLFEADTFFGKLKLCILEVVETVTTTKIVPGSSGGPLVNDDGELVGVASATDGTFGLLVPNRDINRFLASY